VKTMTLELIKQDQNFSKAKTTVKNSISVVA